MVSANLAPDVMTVDQGASAAVVTSGHWIASGRSSSLAWVTVARDLDLRSGILILPPLAYEYWTSHHSLRLLADRLAAQGHTVMRLDYSGTGDSSGNLWDADRLNNWRLEISAALAQLRGMGMQKISLVGLRFGATLALQLAESLDVTALVAWLPIVSGRRYLRELRLMSVEEHIQNESSPRQIIAGSVLNESLLSDIATLSAEHSRPLVPTLIIDRHDIPGAARYAETLSAAGVKVDYAALSGAETMLDVSAEEAGIADAAVTKIQEWVHVSVPSELQQRVGLPNTTSSATWQIDGQSITETVLTLTDLKYVGIETRPSQSTSGITLLFLNSGAEKHVGPGRAWVEYSRVLAQLGHVSVRVDFQGWGESPDNGYRPGRPYDQHAVSDTNRIVAALRALGHQRVIPIGLCAGAWVGLRDIQHLPICGMVAFNPQLYWQLGDGVLTMAQARVWYERVSGSDEFFARREKNLAWVEQINQLPFPVDFWFEQDDQGLRYFNEHLLPGLGGRQCLSSLQVLEFPGLDHSMFRHSKRNEAVAAIQHLISRVCVDVRKQHV